MDLGNNTVFSDSPEELWRRKSCLPVAMKGAKCVQPATSFYSRRYVCPAQPFLR